MIILLLAMTLLNLFTEADSVVLGLDDGSEKKNGFVAISVSSGSSTLAAAPMSPKLRFIAYSDAFQLMSFIMARLLPGNTISISSPPCCSRIIVTTNFLG